MQTCNRIDMRMACVECGYPYSEAMVDTDFSIPHIKYDEFSEHFSETLPDSLGG